MQAILGTEVAVVSPLPPLPEEFGRIKVLVVDDSRTNRMLLASVLSSIGCEVSLAADGLEALEHCKAELPDLIMLDVVMPRMDGYEAAAHIRELTVGRYVPIIFLTALNQTEDVARCYQAGADACFSKPFNPVILQAKVRAVLQTRHLYETVRKHRDQLERHEARMALEFEETHQVLGHISASRVIDAPNIRSLHMPMAVVNGDVLLTGWGPGGVQQVLIGDLTGHGVPAAVGAVVVTEVFHAMSSRGFSGGEILTELNRKLGRMLPSGRFLSAAFIELNRDLSEATIWNAGLPDILITTATGEVMSLKSRAVPIGVLPPEEFELESEHVALTPDYRIYAYTDGVTELRCTDGSFFGVERMRETLSQARISGSEPVDELLALQSRLRAADDAHDDVSLVEVLCDQQQLLVGASTRAGQSAAEERAPGVWKATLEFGADALRRMEPIPVMVQMLTDIEGPRGDRGRIFTILAELYSNAVEHGLLGLESVLKNDSNGFAEYYRERKRRLDNMKEAMLRIELGCRVESDRSEIVIRVAHSGRGFDYNSALQAAGTGQHGRGLALVRALSERLEFSDEGRTAEVLCRW